jgi:hypothetical protein
LVPIKVWPRRQFREEVDGRRLMMMEAFLP